MPSGLCNCSYKEVFFSFLQISWYFILQIKFSCEFLNLVFPQYMDNDINLDPIYTHDPSLRSSFFRGDFFFLPQLKADGKLHCYFFRLVNGVLIPFMAQVILHQALSDGLFQLLTLCRLKVSPPVPLGCCDPSPKPQDLFWKIYSSEQLWGLFQFCIECPAPYTWKLPFVLLNLSVHQNLIYLFHMFISGGGLFTLAWCAILLKSDTDI